MDNLREFLDVLFPHTPDGAFFFKTEIDKRINKAYPRFYKTLDDYHENLRVGQRAGADLYFSPACYRRPTNPVKGNVLGASCVWIDLDSGELPRFDQVPSVVLESSPEHYHVYWTLPEFQPKEYVEAVNRQLYLALGADKSGWDGTQLLRPPGSLNRKRANFEARILELHPDTTATFDVTIPPTDLATQTVTLQGELEEVLARNFFTAEVRDLLFHKTHVDRSKQMFSVACKLIEARMTDHDVEVLIGYLDQRLGKFKSHSDRAEQVKLLVRNARETTGIAPPVENDFSQPLYNVWVGNEELLKDQTEEAFVVEHMLFEEGITIIGGEPGIGKSRLALQMCDSIACGKFFLGKNIHEPMRCVYISLDMNRRRIRDIRAKQQHGFTEEERKLIESNVSLFIRGYGMNLCDSELQARVQQDILDAKARVVFIDVLARAVPSMLDDKDAVKFLDWIQRMVVEHGISFVFVTHTRKGSVDKKTASELDDFYGSRHWSIPPDIGVIMDRAKGELRLVVNKDRSGELPPAIPLHVDYKHSMYFQKTTEQKEAEAAEETKAGTEGKQVDL